MCTLHYARHPMYLNESTVLGESCSLSAQVMRRYVGTTPGQVESRSLRAHVSNQGPGYVNSP